MNLERYPLTATNDYTSYTFESTGHQGVVTKVVQFIPMAIDNFYNFGFGDYDAATGSTNDVSVTNNGDRDKVLATVVYALYVFTTYYPNARVLAVGSTPSRTRLYRMGVTKQLPMATEAFDIYGDVGTYEFEVFVPNTNYTRFLVKRKQERR